VKRDFFSDFFRDLLGKFPDFPSEDDGGSLLIFKEKDPKELKEELEQLVCSEDQPPLG